MADMCEIVYGTGCIQNPAWVPRLIAVELRVSSNILRMLMFPRSAATCNGDLCLLQRMMVQAWRAPLVRLGVATTLGSLLRKAQGSSTKIPISQQTHLQNQCMLP